MSILPLLINKGTIKHFCVLSLEVRVESVASRENFCLSLREFPFRAAMSAGTSQPNRKYKKEAESKFCPITFGNAKHYSLTVASVSCLSCGWGIIRCLLVRTGYFSDSPCIPSLQKSKTKSDFCRSRCTVCCHVFPMVIPLGSAERVWREERGCDGDRRDWHHTPASNEGGMRGSPNLWAFQENNLVFTAVGSIWRIHLTPSLSL